MYTNMGWRSRVSWSHSQLYIYIYIYIFSSLYMHIYIYIYIRCYVNVDCSGPDIYLLSVAQVTLASVHKQTGVHQACRTSRHTFTSLA